ncbi:YebG family protein [Pseudomonas putida]|uniref:YebG family protein n=1 Tax=Pseudomonas putida TaxID=303 RepID=A0A7V8J417_PSEPU|nr:YebG family protein [Pseudomonas putida]KAF0254000.1 hypothetical protein GN299_15120 [Pseudomonas putida]
MAVEQVFRSTHDKETLFMLKADADAYDRKLECAEALSSLFRHVLPNMSEDDAEALGIYIADRRAELASALKKNPADILELIKPQEPASGSVEPLALAS